MSNLDRSKILTRDEVELCVNDLHERRKSSKNAHANLAIFRLSCCLGLRRLEIAGLQMRDVVVEGARPFVTVRADNTKGEDGKRRKRMVPLWWDRGTLRDLKEYYEMRLAMGATLQKDPFICSTRKGFEGNPVTVPKIAARWQTALRPLGRVRISRLSVHAGRRSFCSHALHAGRTLLEVRDAAGHSHVTTTNIYLYAIENEDAPDIFDFED